MRQNTVFYETPCTYTYAPVPPIPINLVTTAAANTFSVGVEKKEDEDGCCGRGCNHMSI
jgi:hypothetical protein